MNAIVIVVDGLQAGMLGCYGNTWIKTPEIDRLAAESFVFDQAIVEGPYCPTLFDAHWSGAHAHWDSRPWASSQDTKLFGALRANGVTSRVITDDVAAETFARDDGNCDVSVIPLRDSTTSVGNLEESQIARVFAAASARLENDKPFCLWINSAGLTGPWDAPYELRTQYADLEDPAPPEFVTPPDLELPQNYDPDELLGIQQAYAGQVSLLDTCIGAFIGGFRASPIAENTLLMLVGACGFGLGEHCGIGRERGGGYSEMIHVPWLVSSPAGEIQPHRTNAIIQPCDLYPTLLEWFDISPTHALRGGKSLWPLIRGNIDRHRDRAAFFTGRISSLRTERWHLRSNHGETSKCKSPKTELYVKPDDRFEVNDVSSRCPDVVAALEDAWRDLVAAAQSGRWDELPPLPEAATHSVD